VTTTGRIFLRFTAEGKQPENVRRFTVKKRVAGRAISACVLNQKKNIMIPEKVIYTDGHDVTVTDSTLQVRNHEYRLNGVIKCGMMVIQPRRAPGIILLILGLVLIVAGAMQAIRPEYVPDMEIAGNLFTANTVAIWLGGALALIGLLILGLMRQRYAVRISTAEGEKDAVVSDKKEYIHQIVDAINQAVNYVRNQTSTGFFDTQTTT
jgi:hypothetical protein